MQGMSEPGREVPPTATESFGCLTSELIFTERKYVQALERFASLKQLVKEQALLQENVFDEVFGNIDALADFHGKFLERLERINTLPEREQNWGRAFSAFEQVVDVYVAYLANRQRYMAAAIRERDKLAVAEGPPEVLEQVSGTAMIALTFLRPYSRLAKYPCILRVRVMPASSLLRDKLMFS